MADNRVAANCKCGGHATPFEAEVGVAYGVNTAMKAVQSAAFDAAINALPTDPCGL
jgi:hypothetical protein